MVALKHQAGVQTAPEHSACLLYRRVNLHGSWARTKTGRGQREIRHQPHVSEGARLDDEEARPQKSRHQARKKKSGIMPDGQRFVGHREIRPRRRMKSGLRTNQRHL